MDAVMSLDEAAAFLKVSSKTLAKEAREGLIPARKVGREWRFSRKVLLDWLEPGRDRVYLAVKWEGEAAGYEVLDVYQDQGRAENRCLLEQERTGQQCDVFMHYLIRGGTEVPPES